VVAEEDIPMFEALLSEEGIQISPEWGARDDQTPPIVTRKDGQVIRHSKEQQMIYAHDPTNPKDGFAAAIEEVAKASMDEANTILSPTRLQFDRLKFDKTQVKKDNPWGEALFPTTVFLTKFDGDGSIEESFIKLLIAAKHIGNNKWEIKIIGRRIEDPTPDDILRATHVDVAAP
jgi:hypothetical protein